MPSPRQFITELLAEVWHDRIGMAAMSRAASCTGLNGASLAGAADRSLHDPPKTWRVDRLDKGMLGAR
jgi:hypothetical protein